MLKKDGYQHQHRDQYQDQYQQKSEASITFTPNKSYAYVLLYQAI